jgi:hypothetical protein
VIGSDDVLLPMNPHEIATESDADGTNPPPQTTATLAGELVTPDAGLARTTFGEDEQARCHRAQLADGGPGASAGDDAPGPPRRPSAAAIQRVIRT